MKQSKNWCFTDFENIDWKSFFEKKCAEVDYVCWGLEICPKSKREHFQGWVQFKTKQRMTAVKKLIGSKVIHVEACKGDEGDNEKYCKKDNKYQSLGEYTVQGKRTDLLEVQQLLKDGKTISDIMDSHFELYCRYRGGIKDYKEVIDKKKAKEFRMLKVNVLWGDTNTGKTRLAVSKDVNCYKITGDSLKWWDGYEGEKTIVIDEYDSQLKCTELLNILDGYHLRLPVKGGFTYAQWDTVYITSNIDPKHWHENAKDQHRKALMRRLTSITHMKKAKSKQLNDKPLNFAKKCAEVTGGNTKPPFIDDDFLMNY